VIEINKNYQKCATRTTVWALNDGLRQQNCNEVEIEANLCESANRKLILILIGPCINCFSSVMFLTHNKYVSV
jgi:hypothetical protein